LNFLAAMDGASVQLVRDQEARRPAVTETRPACTHAATGIRSTFAKTLSRRDFQDLTINQ
jgi:hypothetical protein